MRRSPLETTDPKEEIPETEEYFGGANFELHRVDYVILPDKGLQRFTRRANDDCCQRPCTGRELMLYCML